MSGTRSGSGWWALELGGQEPLEDSGCSTGPSGMHFWGKPLGAQYGDRTADKFSYVVRHSGQRLVCNSLAPITSWPLQIARVGICVCTAVALTRV